MAFSHCPKHKIQARFWWGWEEMGKYGDGKRTKFSHAKHQNPFLTFFFNWNSKFLWRICHETIAVFWWWHLCHAQSSQSQLRHLQPQTPNLPAHTAPEIALGGLRNPTGFQPISSCLGSVINCNCLFDFISIFSGSGQFGKALCVPTGENAHQSMHLLVCSSQLPSGSAFLRASLENET